MLLGNNNWNEWVYYWKAPLQEPWSGTIGSVQPGDTKSIGYGPYIIDAFSNAEWVSGDIEIWHTISVWRGPLGNTPYGVYTGKEEIPWP